MWLPDAMVLTGWVRRWLGSCLTYADLRSAGVTPQAENTCSADDWLGRRQARPATIPVQAAFFCLATTATEPPQQSPWCLPPPVQEHAVAEHCRPAAHPRAFIILAVGVLVAAIVHPRQRPTGSANKNSVLQCRPRAYALALRAK